MILCTIVHAMSVVKAIFPHPMVDLIQLIVCLLSSVAAFATAVVCCQSLPAILSLMPKLEGNSIVSPGIPEIYVRGIVEIAKASVLVLCSNLQILLGNDASKVLLGTTSIVGLYFTEFLHPDDLQSFKDASQLVISSKNLVHIHTLEYRVKLKPPPASPRMVILHAKMMNAKVYCTADDPATILSPRVPALLIGNDLAIPALNLLNGKVVEYMWVESTIMKLSRVNENGQCEHALEIISRNIDERKLSQKILLDTMLKQTEELGRINAAKLRYLSCIAHDLKTPLQSFCYSLDLLLHTKLRTEQREFVQQANVAVDLMKLTISQTMDISKALTGLKLMPRRTNMFISTIIKKVDVIIQGYSKEVPVSFHVAPFINDEIITDEEWLWQMLLNLLTNACKYTDKGSIQVAVSLTALSPKSVLRTPWSNEVVPQTQQLLFEVIDTGIGVSDSHMPSMFDAFSQLQEGQVTGTGLGLFGVRMRAEGLQGTCGARHNTESSTGTGSVMWFAIPYLPDRSHSDDCDQDPTMSQAALILPFAVCMDDVLTDPGALTRTQGPSLDELTRRAEEILQHRPLTAIIVEDTLSIRKLMQKMLLQIGFTSVECYENGSKGLNALMEKEVDVVFSDVQMPIMTGPEMLSRFRKFEAEALATGARSKRQVVVAVTANGSELKDGSGGAGFDDVYPKPLSRHDILTVITEFI